MSEVPRSVSIDEVPRQRESALDVWTRKLVQGLCQGITSGHVTLIDPLGRSTFGVADDSSLLSACVRIHDLGVYRSLAFGGSNALFEAYMDGRWTCDDMVALVRIFVRNPDIMNATDGGLARLATRAQAFMRNLLPNSRGRARTHIAAHYDLGNDFFRLFLDETMTYSAGIFETPEATLRDASIAKIDRLCRKLDLKPDDHLVEIGSGWGALALHAARHYGCRVTTTTISREQFEWTRRRVEEAGFADRITVLMMDYRDLDGRFDKLVSVEMIEAVGHHHFDTFFRTCARLLKPDGLMALQAIVIADQAYETARRTCDFIKRYIFPGSCIPSVSKMMDCVSRVTDFRPADLEELTPHYVRTLRQWRRNLLANLPAIRALGYPERFLRAWDLYFCYCEGGFEERYIGSVQMLLAKPLYRCSENTTAVARWSR